MCVLAAPTAQSLEVSPIELFGDLFPCENKGLQPKLKMLENSVYIEAWLSYLICMSILLTMGLMRGAILLNGISIPSSKIPGWRNVEMMIAH